MLFSIENKESLQDTLERIKIIRTERKKPNLAKFFGVLPNFEDGLEYQKKVRDEWD